MTPFLYRIAQAFYERYGHDISQLAFVFPNRRSGIFFQKYLAEVAGKPLFSPRVTTINDLMAELSPYTTIDGVKVHIYERSLHPDAFTAPKSFGTCFRGCTALTDWDAIGSGYAAWTK